MDWLLTTGFQKPVCALDMEDRDNIRGALVDYHCLLRVKAEMDQFRDDVGVLEFVRQNPDLMRPMLTDSCHGRITAGNYTNIALHDLRFDLNACMHASQVTINVVRHGIWTY